MTFSGSVSRNTFPRDFKYFLESLTMLFVACLFLSTEAAHANKNLVSNYKSGISSFLKFPPCAFVMNK